jgi:hypothetical protein
VLRERRKQIHVKIPIDANALIFVLCVMASKIEPVGLTRDGLAKMG